MSEKLHPSDWTCPGCRERFKQPHWKDHHQKEPGWQPLGKVSFAKASNLDFATVCEICGEPLGTDVGLKTDAIWCPMCKEERSYDEDSYCAKCGTMLIHKPPERNWCSNCNATREGIPAPLFCPACGWEQDRVVLVKVS